MSEKLLGEFQGLQFTDIIGFGRILDVEEEDDFDDFITNIIIAFCQQSRKKRKQLLKLAKDVKEANKLMGSRKSDKDKNKDNNKDNNTNNNIGGPAVTKVKN